MTGRKTTEQRAKEVLRRYLIWSSRNGDAIHDKRRQKLRDLICEAIADAEAALAKRLQAKRERPAWFIYNAFPFEGHRTLAEVMDTGDVA